MKFFELEFQFLMERCDSEEQRVKYRRQNCSYKSLYVEKKTRKGSLEIRKIYYHGESSFTRKEVF